MQLLGLERNSERLEGEQCAEQIHHLARTSVILARRSPTEKLALSGYGTCLVQKNNLNAIAGGLSAKSELGSERHKKAVAQRTASPRPSWRSR